MNINSWILLLYMNEKQAAQKILEYNKEKMTRVLNSSLENSMICKYFVLHVVIDMFHICEDDPNAANCIMKKRTLHLIEEEITSFVSDFFKQNKYLNTARLDRKGFYNLQYVFIVPVSIFKVNLCDMYKQMMYQNACQALMFENKQDTNVHEYYDTMRLYCVEGYIQKTKTIVEPKSCYFKCENSLCVDKSTLLKLDTIGYVMSESNKSFCCMIVDDFKHCNNCKSILKERVEYKTNMAYYEYVISDTKQNLYATSCIDVGTGDCFLCTTQRRNNGKLVFHILAAYKKQVDVIKYKSQSNDMNVLFENTDIESTLFEGTDIIGTLSNNSRNVHSLYGNKNNTSKQYQRTQHKNINRSYEHKNTYTYTSTNNTNIENTFCSITTFLCDNIKKASDLHDCLLLIMLNILCKDDSSMLIFTSDTFYVRKFAIHYFNVKDVDIQIYYDFRSFKNKKGLCIREYEEAQIKDIDFVFHIPIDHMLDYSYSVPIDKIKIYNHKVNLYEHDHEYIKSLFIQFRNKYRRIIEPERLLNTLTSLYISIIEYVGRNKHINDFILNHFIDKLL